jgi:hypothetical protein
MKLVRFNLEGTTQRVWVLQHDLSSREGPISKTRPVHVLTFVYATHAQKLLATGSHERASQLSTALEAKLSAVQHLATAVNEAFAKIPNPDADGRDIASFNEASVFIAEVEAYLGALYSSLELTNGVVKAIHPKVKQGFRKMAKSGYGAFRFDRWPWLASFYDVRTELCHFGSPLPWIDGGALVLDITQSHETHRFKRGSKVAVPIAELVQYREGLLAMLDAWALDQLRSLDQNLSLYQLVFDSNGQRKGEHPTLREFMEAHL